MIKEIGSEFWEANCNNFSNSMFNHQVQWFACGRSALKAIVSDLKDVKTVAMPSWCCHTMIKPFFDHGIKVLFYPVYFTDHLVQEVRYDCDVLYVMDYFGFSSNTNIKHQCLIRDVTHSLFSKCYNDADYYYGSLRKWCGVWTGGYTWNKDGRILNTDNQYDISQYILLRERGMKLKSEYIENPEEFAENKGTFLSYFNKAEKFLEDCPASPASKRDVEIAIHLDIDFIRRRRRENAKILMEELSDYTIFKELNQDDTPLFVPIRVNRDIRDSLRQYLIDNYIYCPCHWTISDYHKLYEKTREIYEQEISLICDQRYGKEDMERIVTVIKCFFDNL